MKVEKVLPIWTEYRSIRFDVSIFIEIRVWLFDSLLTVLQEGNPHNSLIFLFLFEKQVEWKPIFCAYWRSSRCFRAFPFWIWSIWWFYLEDWYCREVGYAEWRVRWKFGILFLMMEIVCDRSIPYSIFKFIICAECTFLKKNKQYKRYINYKIVLYRYSKYCCFRYTNSLSTKIRTNLRLCHHHLNRRFDPIFAVSDYF